MPQKYKPTKITICMVYVHDVTVPQLRTKWLGKIRSSLLITDDSKQTIKNLCSQVMLQEVESSIMNCVN